MDKTKDKLTDIEKKVLAVLQEGLPVAETPYEQMAERIGIETDKLLEVLEKWKQSGKLKRIVAIVNQYKIGLGSAALVAWQADSRRIGEVGRILAGFTQASHVYQREAAKDWPYNIYTMVHTADEQQLERVIEQMSKQCDVSSYRVMTTKKEFKKTAAQYIIQTDR